MVSFKYYNHLGFFNPYYVEGEDGFYITNSNIEAISSLKDRAVDVVSIVELLSLGYCLGDRTLVQGVKRTPWMAKPSDDMSTWDFFTVPTHKEEHLNQNVVVEKFFVNLRNELLDYIAGKAHIGVLLTGGMDSRVLACVLDSLVRDGSVVGKTITAFTWGGEDSRDVIYARRIAEMLGWEWKHLTVDVAQMEVNMEYVIEEGCEYTPVHLHAMPKIIEHNYLDCVLAGSFGDSIGRGEYSGRKLNAIGGIQHSIKNFSHLFNNKILSDSLIHINKDILGYHYQFPQDKNYQVFEQDLQIHYMRRMLNPCMGVINRHVPLFQLFTDPKVFGFMWSLEPSLRNDDIYYKLLQTYNSSLLSIPWARTGLLYPLKKGVADGYTKKHHDYGKMIRESFYSRIQHDIKFYELAEFDIFNVNAIYDLLRWCKNYPFKGSLYYEERLLWIACLSKYLRTNEIENSIKCRSGVVGRMLSSTEYYFRYLYKKAKG